MLRVILGVGRFWFVEIVNYWYFMLFKKISRSLCWACFVADFRFFTGKYLLGLYYVEFFLDVGFMSIKVLVLFYYFVYFVNFIIFFIRENNVY